MGGGKANWSVNEKDNFEKRVLSNDATNSEHYAYAKVAFEDAAPLAAYDT